MSNDEFKVKIKPKTGSNWFKLRNIQQKNCVKHQLHNMKYYNEQVHVKNRLMDKNSVKVDKRRRSSIRHSVSYSVKNQAGTRIIFSSGTKLTVETGKRNIFHSSFVFLSEFIAPCYDYEAKIQKNT